MKNLTVFSLIVVFLFCGSLVNSQQVVTRSSTKIDLIKRRIKKSSNDTVKINLLQQWSDLVFITDPQKDLELQQQVIDIYWAFKKWENTLFTEMVQRARVYGFR